MWVLGRKGVVLACCFHNQCGRRWPCWRSGPVRPSCCGHSWCESARCSPLAHQKGCIEPACSQGSVGVGGLEGREMQKK